MWSDQGYGSATNNPLGGNTLHIRPVWRLGRGQTKVTKA
jgi:hypothetical protein